MMNCRMVGIILLIAFIMSCASTTPVTKYMPKERDGVFPFFSSGQPIAAVQASNAFMLLSLDRTRLAQEPYFRLWILYQNISEGPYLLEPLRFISLNVTSVAERKEGVSTPKSPTKILASVSNEKALSMIMQAIGGTLHTMAVKPTSATTSFNDGSSATTTFNDMQEKKDAVASRTTNAMLNTTMWYDIYQNSISDGILRRNTVFPGQSVNGYIYFPIPDSSEMNDSDSTSYPEDLANEKYFYKIEMQLSSESRSVYFTRIEGE